MTVLPGQAKHGISQVVLLNQDVDDLYADHYKVKGKQHHGGHDTCENAE